MFGYTIPAIIPHSVIFEEDINPPAGIFATTLDNATALICSTGNSGGIGVSGYSNDGHGIDGNVGGAGVGVYGHGPADGSTAMFADSHGSNGIGLRCRASQSTSAAIVIEGKTRTDQAVIHTLGAYSGKAVPVYDTGGTLLGYIPLYS